MFECRIVGHVTDTLFIEGRADTERVTSVDVLVQQPSNAYSHTQTQSTTLHVYGFFSVILHEGSSVEAIKYCPILSANNFLREKKAKKDSEGLLGETLLMRQEVVLLRVFICPFPHFL